MRTTITIDDDVLARARQLADQSGQSLGAVVSDLARKSLASRPSGSTRNGIILLPPGPAGTVSTLDDVNRLRDETL